jgi:hypothetical protein
VVAAAYERVVAAADSPADAVKVKVSARTIRVLDAADDHSIESAYIKIVTYVARAAWAAHVHVPTEETCLPR